MRVTVVGLHARAQLRESLVSSRQKCRPKVAVFSKPVMILIRMNSDCWGIVGVHVLLVAFITTSPETLIIALQSNSNFAMMRGYAEGTCHCVKAILLELGNDKDLRRERYQTVPRIRSERQKDHALRRTTETDSNFGFMKAYTLTTPFKESDRKVARIKVYVGRRIRGSIRVSKFILRIYQSDSNFEMIKAYVMDTYHCI